MGACSLCARPFSPETILRGRAFLVLLLYLFTPYLSSGPFLPSFLLYFFSFPLLFRSLCLAILLLLSVVFAFPTCLFSSQCFRFAHLGYIYLVDDDHGWVLWGSVNLRQSITRSNQNTHCRTNNPTRQFPVRAPGEKPVRNATPFGGSLRLSNLETPLFRLELSSATSALKREAATLIRPRKK